MMLAACHFHQHEYFLSNAAMAQEYDNYYDMIINIAIILQKINKYECRTGPFEGFFVSSVEFCNI